MKDELEKLKRVKAKRRKRSTINERICNTEAVRSFHHYGWGAYKIPDVLGSKFTGDKPCDIIAESPKGRYVAVEGKLIKKWCKLSPSILRPNQIFELNRAKRSFLFLYIRIKANKEKGTKRVHKLCVIDWKEDGKWILKNGVVKYLLEEQEIGRWLEPLKDKNGKTIYDIRKILNKD